MYTISNLNLVLNQRRFSYIFLYFRIFEIFIQFPATTDSPSCVREDLRNSYERTTMNNLTMITIYENDNKMFMKSKTMKKYSDVSLHERRMEGIVFSDETKTLNIAGKSHHQHPRLKAFSELLNDSRND